ncbi:hypothetical protein FSP39_004283 [Pinctada imbricata]|uniref:Hexosyltransferase n=1 Tax=Pinctada imbricata TaxID=66713 RepID=A0AA89BYN3_PINIB|nr:hypothetical protein FSP39_004283 [Pinctada imbricata]
MHRQEHRTDNNKELLSYDTSSFIINEVEVCGPPRKSAMPVLLVGVYSSAGQVLERDFIRRNWSAVVRTNHKIRVLFFMGVPPEEKDMEIIRNESMHYHDIIVRNFLDTYRNLTLKSFAFFQWSQRYCKGARYLLKIDCDMQIDLLRLLSVLETGRVADTYQCGKVFFESHPFRNKQHKWYVPPSLYSKKLFPPYCYGPAYVVSRRIASKIAKQPIPKDPFPVDDVYMSGLLREKLHEKLSHDFLFFHHHYAKTQTKIVKGKYTKYIMTVHVLYEMKH